MRIINWIDIVLCPTVFSFFQKSRNHKRRCLKWIPQFFMLPWQHKESQNLQHKTLTTYTSPSNVPHYSNVIQYLKLQQTIHSGVLVKNHKNLARFRNNSASINTWSRLTMRPERMKRRPKGRITTAAIAIICICKQDYVLNFLEFSIFRQGNIRIECQCVFKTVSPMLFTKRSKSKFVRNFLWGSNEFERWMFVREYRNKRN